MVIYAESSAVDDPLLLKDEKFAAVRSQICIFKEGELFFFFYKKQKLWYRIVLECERLTAIVSYCSNITDFLDPTQQSQRPQI